MSKFALMFLMVFFSGIVITLFYSGTASFMLYQFIYFMNPTARWWSVSIPGISYSFFAVLLMLFALVRHYKEYSELSPWTRQPVFKWVIGLLIMYYLAYTYALNMAYHDRFTYDFTKLVIIILVAYKLLHSKMALNLSLWAYIIGATYIGYLAQVTGRSSGARVEGIGLVDAPDANGTAAALVPAGALLMYYAWMGNWRVRFLCVICGALIANGLVLINSRGAFLGTVAGAGLYLMFMIFSRYRRQGQRAMAIFIAVAGLSGAFYLTDDLFWERMGTLQNLESKESGAGRVTFWLKTFDMLEDYPMGMGVYGYNALAAQYMDDETRGGVEQRSVHSMWFQGLGEVGWIGFGLFVGALVSLYRLSAKAKSWVLSEQDNQAYFHLLAIECALISYLVAGTFINQFRSEILYWMILLLAVGSNVYYLQPTRQTQSRSVGTNQRIRKKALL